MLYVAYALKKYSVPWSTAYHCIDCLTVGEPSKCFSEVYTILQQIEQSIIDEVWPNG